MKREEIKNSREALENIAILFTGFTIWNLFVIDKIFYEKELADL